jgi:hypothetical protein
MNREDAEEYTQALGQVAAGSFRQVALGMRLGVPQALGLSMPEWVNERLGGYVKLSIPTRRAAAKELTAPEEEGGMGLSGRTAAVVLGVDEGTVRNDLSGDADDSAPPRIKKTKDAEDSAPCSHTCGRHCPSERGKQ